MLELSLEVRRRHFGLWLVGALNLVLAAVFLATPRFGPLKTFSSATLDDLGSRS